MSSLDIKSYHIKARSDAISSRDKFISPIKSLNILKSSIISPETKNLVNSATEKVMDWCLKNPKLSKYLVNQEVFRNKNISVYLDNLVKKNPELWSFIYVDLWLNSARKPKYEQLSSPEKIKLLALDNLLNNKVSTFFSSYTNKAGTIDVTLFKNSYKEQMKWFVSNLTIDFKLNQLSNLWDITKTLKNDYKLTDKEASVYVSYLENLKNQSNNVQEAWLWWYAFVAVLSMIVWAMGMKYYYDFTHPESQTIIQSGRVEIWDPKTIAKLLSVEAPFKTTWTLKKELYKINDDDNAILKALKKSANIPQSHEITMEVDGKYAVEFDLDRSTFEYDYTTKKIYAHLKSPKILITDFNPKIIKKNWEIFEMSTFDWVQTELMNTLKENVVKEGKNRTDILNKAKINTANTLRWLYTLPLSLWKFDVSWVEVIIDDLDTNTVSQENDVVKISH